MLRGMKPGICQVDKQEIMELWQVWFPLLPKRSLTALFNIWQNTTKYIIIGHLFMEFIKMSGLNTFSKEYYVISVVTPGHLRIASHYLLIFLCVSATIP